MSEPAFRTARRRGATIIEFTLILLPFFVLLTILLSIAWAIFAKSTLQHAVRVGVRFGVTNQVPAGSNLTAEVKKTVQWAAPMFLTGDSGLSKIKVHYLQPPAPNSTGPTVDVCDQANGNAGGNLMVVSVEGYSLFPLLPRIYSWGTAPDASPMALTLRAADRIEPIRNPPPKGAAP
jgi:Flp pilus assembly protein TadG